MASHTMWQAAFKPRRIVVTGTAGFIGFHLAHRLLDEGHDVFGIDNFNDYYSVQLKRDRHALLESRPQYQWRKVDLTDLDALKDVFHGFAPDVVVNLAAQAGVRYSITNPHAYLKSNLEGFLNVLECCRHLTPKPRLVYASSSSVYGGNTELPFSEDQRVDTPISLYAATKKANELMAHCYSHLYGIQTVGLRFFTVYGPWGRPDMAYWIFADAIRRGQPIRVFNNGEMCRDFTYIDDVVEGIVGCIRSQKMGRFEVFNIGNNHAENLMDLVSLIARELNVAHPQLVFVPMQDGDMVATFASVDKLQESIGYKPATPLSIGIPRFVRWFTEYRNGAGLQ